VRVAEIKWQQDAGLYILSNYSFICCITNSLWLQLQTLVILA